MPWSHNQYGPDSPDNPENWQASSWNDKRLEDAFGRVCRKLDRIDAMLRGNGGPGVLVRVDRLELRDRMRSKALWLVSSIAVTLIVLLSWELIVKG